MHLLDVLGAVFVKPDNLLAGRVIARLLKVRVEPGEEVVGALRDAVVLVGSLGAVCRVVLAVQLVQGVEEAAGDVVLLVELQGALDGRVADDVAVREVLGDDPGARLLLLGDFIRVALVVGDNFLVGISGRGAGDGDVVGAQLGVVQQKGRFARRLLLKGDVGNLGVAIGGDPDVGYFAAEGRGSGVEMSAGGTRESASRYEPEAKEFLNLGLAGGVRDVLDVDGGHGVFVLP